MAARKPKAKNKPAGKAKAAPARKAAPKKAAKKSVPAAKAKAGYAAAARNPLLHEIAEHLGASEAEAIDQALAAFAVELGLRGGAREIPQEKSPADAPPRTASSSIAAGGYLPRRLYLHLDSRGIDGAGMPAEVIDFPCTLGSGRRNTIWINSPQVETVHAQIVESEGGWTFEDLGSEHGTFLNGKRITKVPVRDGETFLLAGYVRVKTELK